MTCETRIDTWCDCATKSCFRVGISVMCVNYSHIQSPKEKSLMGQNVRTVDVVRIHNSVDYITISFLLFTFYFS